MVEGSGPVSGRVRSNFLSAIAGRVGSGQRFAGSGRVGFNKSDPWTSLSLRFQYNEYIQVKTKKTIGL